MYHQGGEEQRSRAASLFALLLLPRRVHPHLTCLMFRHFKCNAAFAHLLCLEIISTALEKQSSCFFCVFFFSLVKENSLQALHEASIMSYSLLLYSIMTEETTSMIHISFLHHYWLQFFECKDFSKQISFLYLLEENIRIFYQVLRLFKAETS